jgi:hypothetical protein
MLCEHISSIVIDSSNTVNTDVTNMCIKSIVSARQGLLRTITKRLK